MPNLPAENFKPLGERDVLQLVEAALVAASGQPPEGELWIGDDAAVLARPKGAIVAASDSCVGGVHGDLNFVEAGDLGWRAMVATLSDIGAMGAVPWFALVNVISPSSVPVMTVMKGVAEASATFSCPVVGGDMSSGDQVVVSVSVVGNLVGEAPALVRAGACVGDTLFVTGPLGGSNAGLRALREGATTAGAKELISRHVRPTPRLKEGVLARAVGVNACIDISDGLAIDLDRMAIASGVGVALEYVPTAPGATLHDALSGGEDYELVFSTATADALIEGFAREGISAPIRIGEVVADATQRTLEDAPFAVVGYQHPLH
jgi:thiamine-monophosphate kinase